MKQPLAGAIRASVGALGLPVPDAIELSRPARREFGAWSANVALALAKQAGKPPRQLADEIAGALELPEHVAGVEVAGPGFLNFRLHPSWRRDLVRAAREPIYGRHDWGAGQRVQVEFVSANPTGPLHVGNGWWASYGDALARLLEATGHEVTREYYVNDTGGQIRTLGESLLARRRREAVPDQGYQGEYVTDLAKEYDGPEGDVTKAGRWAAEVILENIRDTLDGMGVHFDEWRSQASYEETEAVHRVVEFLRQKGMVFEADGAVWLGTADMGVERGDRVLVKSDGDYTYLAGDLAYHYDKFVIRKFDQVINVWGADHQGQVASLLAGVEALGVAPGRLEILIGQMVSLAQGRMSKRAGHAVPLAELVAQIGIDATRFLSLLSSIDSPTTLDLEMAVKQDLDNPVYYVQMAHARVCSIAARAAERGITLAHGDPGILEESEADDVAYLIEDFPDMIDEATRMRAPHKVVTWSRKLAAEVHGYYHRYPVLPAAPDVRNARYGLLDAARVVLGRALGLLGVTAPERMAALDE